MDIYVMKDPCQLWHVTSVPVTTTCVSVQSQASLYQSHSTDQSQTPLNEHIDVGPNQSQAVSHEMHDHNNGNHGRNLGNVGFLVAVSFNTYTFIYHICGYKIEQVHLHSHQGFDKLGTAKLYQGNRWYVILKEGKFQRWRSPITAILA